MTQTALISRRLMDGHAHSSYDLAEYISNELYGGARSHLIALSQRIGELKRSGWVINGWRDKDNPQKYWYQATAHNGELIFPKEGGNSITVSSKSRQFGEKKLSLSPKEGE